MQYIVKAREIVKAMRPTGTFRLSVETDEDGTVPRPLCDCVGGHESMAAARKCPKALDAMRNLTPETFLAGLMEELTAPSPRKR